MKGSKSNSNSEFKEYFDHLNSTLGEGFRDIEWELRRLGIDKPSEPDLSNFYTYPLKASYSDEEIQVLQERLKNEYKLYETQIEEYFKIKKKELEHDLEKRGITYSGENKEKTKQLELSKKRILKLLEYRKEHMEYEINRLSEPLLRATIDANIVIDYLGEKLNNDIKNIITAYFSKKIDLTVTHALPVDIRNASDKMKQRLFEFLKLIPIIETKKGNKKLENIRIKVEKIIFPSGIKGKKRSNDYLDTLHLATHIFFKRSIFITNDKKILKKHQELKLAFPEILVKDSVNSASIINGRI